jgi:hypothetical protein
MAKSAAKKLAAKKPAAKKPAAKKPAAKKPAAKKSTAVKSGRSGRLVGREGYIDYTFPVTDKKTSKPSKTTKPRKK